MPKTATVDVCLCTFRRPAVAEALASLDAQALPPGVILRVIVADNDDTPSSETRVAEAAAGMRHEVVYLHAPARNISVARNACLERADAPFVAFLDDDEVASADWIAQLLACLGGPAATGATGADRAQPGADEAGADESGAGADGSGAVPAGAGATGAAGTRAGGTGAVAGRVAQAPARRADVAFGPALARYPPGTPEWIVANDFHSNRPVRRGTTVETGHTCNVMMRFAGTPAATTRFDLALGRTGGEDTDFFFRLHRQGMRLAICEGAVVHEDVEPHRLRWRWLVDRRFAEGRHYGRAAGRARAVLLAGSLAKAGYSGLRALGAAGNRPRLAFWALRAVFHAGICTGCVSGAGRREAYGG